MNKSIDIKKIEKQAKDILEKFSSALEKVEKEGEIDSFVDREEFQRIEGKGSDSPKGFKRMLLENSPRHDDDFIIGEKGAWK